jgi:hypothetical protein
MKGAGRRSLGVQLGCGRHHQQAQCCSIISDSPRISESLRRFHEHSPS